MDEETNKKLEVKSSAFQNEEEMPEKYGYSHENVNPPITIEGIPEGAKTLALIVDDPDAPMERPFVHWVVFNIPVNENSETIEIPEGSVSNLEGAIEGANDFGSNGYGGPRPPSGTHRYQFKVYALDTSLDLEEGASKQDVLDAIQENVLAQGQLTGLFPSEKA